MVNLTRIYTRTGDDGTTALGDGTRTSKTDPRLSAYADVDETNCMIGVVVTTGGLPNDVQTLLLRIQNDLFDVGADLATPLTSEPKGPELRVRQGYIDELESACDRLNADLKPLRSFVLPGGSLISARLHVARAVCRRAERSVWTAIEEHGTEPDGGVSLLAATYLNRLSDLLFILCRYANLGKGGGDVLWEPGGGRSAVPGEANG